MDALGIIAGIFCVIVAIAINIFKDKQQDKRKERAEDERKKPVEEMTPAEKKRKLEIAAYMYRRGKLSFAEYDALKALYSGEKSFMEVAGVEATMDVSNRLSKR